MDIISLRIFLTSSISLPPGRISNEMSQNDLNSADFGVSLRKKTFQEGEVRDDVYIVVGGMGEDRVVFSRDLRAL